mgnify:CR=1 FL=1
MVRGARMNDNIFSNFDDRFKEIKEILKREYKSDYLVGIYFDLFFLSIKS